MTKKLAKTAKTIIGWREWCGLPALGLPPVAAKIDTGAKTSCLHAFNLSFSEKDGKPWVKFAIHPVQRKKSPEMICEAPVVEMRKVFSSNGMAENRPVIATKLQLGHLGFITEITLTNRDEMGYRMLIGRKSLAGRFIVDPHLSWALGETATDTRPASEN